MLGEQKVKWIPRIIFPSKLIVQQNPCPRSSLLCSPAPLVFPGVPLPSLGLHVLIPESRKQEFVFCWVELFSCHQWQRELFCWLSLYRFHVYDSGWYSYFLVVVFQRINIFWNLRNWCLFLRLLSWHPYTFFLFHHHISWFRRASPASQQTLRWFPLQPSL